MNALTKRLLIIALIGVSIPLVLQDQVDAGDRRKSFVSPVLEIEVIDPGVDARGNPAVVLQDAGVGMVVDIPPCVLVHRYYFTGQRSFRGPNLPGGPSIVVANHPKTGERTYVSAQLLPGSPMVHYTGRSIEYDYGDTGITIVFPRSGDPHVKVRSGRKLSDRVTDVLPVKTIRNVRESVGESTTSARRRLGLAAEGALLSAGDVLQPITQPAEHLFRLIPGVVALTDPDTELENARRAIEYNQEKRRERQAFRTRLDQLDYETIR